MIRWFLIAMLMLVSGCQYLNPIAPILQIGVFWMEGEAHKYYNTDADKVHQATLNALKKLNIPVIKEEPKDDYLYILAGDDDKFKIKIREVRENITKLSIRVNTFGDKPYAELIYQNVDVSPGIKSFLSVDELNQAMERRPRIKRRFRKKDSHATVGNEQREPSAY